MASPSPSFLKQVLEAHTLPGVAPAPGESSRPEATARVLSPFMIAGPPALDESAHPPKFKALAPPMPETEVEKAGLEHFRILLDHAPVAMAMFDLEMRYLLANTRWQEDFKLSGQGIIGRSHYDLFPTLHPGWRHVYQRALEGQVVRCDRDAMTQNGKQIVYRWEVRPWRQQDTRIGGIMITCSRLQVSEEPSMPAHQEEQPHDVDQLWDGPLSMMAVDADGKILHASRGASTFLLPKGLQEGETTLWEALGERSEQQGLRERIERALKTVLHDGGAQEVIRTAQSAEDESLDGMPAHWLFTCLSEEREQHPAVALVIGLEGVPMLPPVRIKVSEESDTAADAALELQKRLLEATDAEKLSRQRENRIRSVLDLMPCGLVVLDEKTQLIYQNPRLRQLLGREIVAGQRVEEWLMLGCRDEVHAREVQRLWQEDIWRRRLTQVLTLVSADDLLKDVEIRPVALPGGGMMLMLQDITETRRGEEMLRSTEAKFRTLVHENPNPVVLTDRSGAVFDVNPAAEVLLGHPRAELRRMGLEQWLDEASIKRRAEAIAEMTDREATSGEITATLRSRAKEHGVPVAMRLALVLDATQQALFTVHFLEPVKAESPAFAPVESLMVTEAEAAVNETDVDEVTCGDDFLCLENDPEIERIRSEVELLTTDAHGRVLEWTAEAVELFGHAESDMRNHGLYTLFRPADEAGFHEQLAAVHAQAREGYEVTWNFTPKDGGRKFATFVVHSIGDLPLAVRLARRVDIEKPRTSPAPKADAAPATTTRRVDRVAEPASRSVLEQQRLVLGETHQRVKDHLQIINSMLNLQMNTLRNEEARNVLRSSQNRIRSIAALHQHLSRIAAGEETHFAALAVGLVEHLRECFDISADRVSVAFHLPDARVPEPWLLPLSLALNEMVSNVFKHAYPQDRSGAVQLNLGWDEASGTLSVCDDGIGLPADFADRHHEGMGLKILRVFAGQLGGELRISSPESGGACFELQFPVNAHR